MRIICKLAAAIVMAAGLGGVAGAPEAGATVACSFSASTARVTVTMTANESAGLSIGADGRILVNGAACGTATRTNTNLISVVGSSSGNETVLIDLSGGAFAPGATSESTGVSELEISIDLAGGSDGVHVRGTPNADRVTFGSSGIALTGDTDPDVRLTAVENLGVEGRDGDDRLSGAGGFGTGDPTSLPTVFLGGRGRDALVGGLAGDRFYTNDGEADSLDGSRGTDCSDHDSSDTRRSIETGCPV